jgi:hypothetical protein
MYILPPPNRRAYSSKLTCGNGQIFAVGRLKVPLVVLRVTTSTMPLGPGWTSAMTAMGPESCCPPSVAQHLLVVG